MFHFFFFFVSKLTKMKKILAAALLLSFVVFASCSKASNELVSELDRVEILFQELKQDPVYEEYYRKLNGLALLIMDNAKKTKLKDSVVLQNGDLSMKEKYDILGLDNVESITQTSLASFQLFQRLKKQYPILGQLSQEEDLKLKKLSKSFFLTKQKT